MPIPTAGQITHAIELVAKEIALRDVAFEDEEYRSDYVSEHFTESTIAEQKEAMRILIQVGFAHLELLKGVHTDGQYSKAS